MADTARSTTPKRALLKREILCKSCYYRFQIRHLVADEIKFF